MTVKLANEPLTLVHHTKSREGDSYACWPFRGSWYRQNRAAVTQNGLQSAQIVKCRIPCWGLGSTELGRLAALRPGDKVLRGTLTACDGAAFAALGRTHGAAAVLDVHDNTRGVSPHYYIEGAG